jgi:hypothetical protein
LLIWLIELYGAIRINGVFRVIRLLRMFSLYCYYSNLWFKGYFIVIGIPWAISIVAVIRIIRLLSVVRNSTVIIVILILLVFTRVVRVSFAPV